MYMYVHCINYNNYYNITTVHMNHAIQGQSLCMGRLQVVRHTQCWVECSSLAFYLYQLKAFLITLIMYEQCV